MSGKMNGSGGEVCEDFLRGCCASLEHGDDPQHIHYTLPYMWQLELTSIGRGKIALPQPQAVALEYAFCDPACEKQVLNIREWGAMTLEVEFETMMVSYSSLADKRCTGSAPILRLSTASYAAAISETYSACNKFLTQWRWYWRVGSNWKMFGEQCRIPSQSVLESKFVSGRQKLYLFEFDDEGEFILNLHPGPLSLTRLKDRLQWPVRRRPLIVTPQNVAANTCQLFPSITKPLFANCIPQNWAPIDTEQEAELVPIDPNSVEYHLIAAEFEKTVPKILRKICDIFRIQNVFLWHKYASKKLYMEHSGKALNELQLFHGTRDDKNVLAIARQNFDFRLAGAANATCYGKGMYFAISASVSDKYSYTEYRQRSWMFLARVIIGRCTVGTSKMVRPPPLNEEKPQAGLYDSCTDDTYAPRLYVVFDTDQVYPEYAISYSNA